jgi:hypothetical protein
VNPDDFANVKVPTTSRKKANQNYKIIVGIFFAVMNASDVKDGTKNSIL